MELRIVKKTISYTNGATQIRYCIERKYWLLGWNPMTVKVLRYSHSRREERVSCIGILSTEALCGFSTEQKAKEIMQLLIEWEEDIVYKNNNINVIFDYPFGKFSYPVEPLYVNYSNGQRYPPLTRSGHCTEYGYEHAATLENLKARIDSRQPVKIISSTVEIIK